MAQEAGDLISKLRAVQQRTSRASWDERRHALRHCLQHELGNLDTVVAAKILGEVKQRLGSSRGGGASSEDRQLLQDTLQRTEALESVRKRLEEELESARTRIATLEAAIERRNETDGPDAGSGDVFRRAVRDLGTRRKGKAEELGLNRSDGHLYEVISEVASAYDSFHRNISMLMLELSGKTEAGGTMLERAKRGEFRKFLTKSLAGDERTFAKLKNLMFGNSKSLLLMHSAFMDGFKPAVQELLGALDPEQTLQTHKEMLGFDYEAAYKDLASKIGDLQGLTSRDLWDGYLTPQVREVLGTQLDSLPPI